MIRLRRTAAADCSIDVDGVPVAARAGETLLAALGAGGCSAVPAYCGMGVCHACLVEVDGRPGVRACTERVHPGMAVVTGGWAGA